ncbi:MAG: response regulator [Chitinophagaceae bacterium]|nr:MAG: response regulator [Chitinophagaceae bacterium]
MPINQANNRTIIFGEDDIDDIDFLKETFSVLDNSFNLLFIDKGRKLLAKLETLTGDELPCLLVLDYNMPELNGAEILAQLKQDNRYNSIPKIIWSTSGSDTYKNKCLELGAVDYVIKPDNVKDYLETVRYMLTFCGRTT